MHGDHQSNDLFARLIAAATAYPRDLFPPLSEDVRAQFPEPHRSCVSRDGQKPWALAGRGCRRGPPRE